MPGTYVENCYKAQNKNFCRIENAEQKNEVEIKKFILCNVSPHFKNAYYFSYFFITDVDFLFQSFMFNQRLSAKLVKNTSTVIVSVN